MFRRVLLMSALAVSVAFLGCSKDEEEKKGPAYEASFDDGSLKETKGAAVTEENKEKAVELVNTVIMDMSSSWGAAMGRSRAASQSIDTTITTTIEGKKSGKATNTIKIVGSGSEESYSMDVDMKMVFDDFANDSTLYLGGSVVYDMSISGNNEAMNMDADVIGRLKFAGLYKGTYDYDASMVMKNQTGTIDLKINIESEGKKYTYEYSGDLNDMDDSDM